ncbi:hypothetical protein RUND412_007300 [Rhizina undulata]
MPPRVNIPPLTRAALIISVILTVFTSALRYRLQISQQLPTTPPSDSPDAPSEPGTSPILTVPYLTSVPAQSLLFPWTLLTSTFVEQNIFTLIVALGTLFYGGKYLERAWGSKEFGKFLLVVSLVPNLIAFLFCIAAFAVTGDVNWSFTPISGATALQAGFLVSFKQLVPEHTVTLFRTLIKLRVKHFPLLFLLCNTISWPLLGTPVAAVLAWSGFYASWMYLRFYKRTFPDIESQTSGLRGDASETFAMAYFFPDQFQRPIAIISIPFYNALATLRIITPFSASDIALSNSRAEARGDATLNSIFGRGTHAPLPGRAEAERRRALALKALDQRLHAATAGGKGGGLGETSLDGEAGHS